MSDPTKYTRDYSFTDFQAGNPSAPLPGIQVDNELENVEQSLNEAIDAIKDVRRSDGKLKNGIVTIDSLDPQVAAGVGAGALASAEAAASSASAAADSAEAAASSAGAASGYAGTAATSAGQAMTFRNEAEGQKTLAQTARTGAQTARDFAAQWSSAPQGQDVNDGVNPVNKSAYHWAQIALGAATGAIPDGSVTEPKLAEDVIVKFAAAAMGIPAPIASPVALVADAGVVLGYAGSGAKIEVSSGDIVGVGPYRYVAANGAATDHDLETSGGVKFNLLRGPDGRFAVSALGLAEGSDITAEMQKFFAKLRLIGAPETVVIDGFWLISDPIRLPFNVKLYGSGQGQLRATGAFGSVTFDRADGPMTPLSIKAMFWCAETAGSVNIATIGNMSGSRREGLYIDRSVILDCRDIADYGLFVDNVQNSYMACEIRSPLQWGVFDYSNGWGNKHYESIKDPSVGGIWSRVAGNGVDMSGSQIFGNSKTPTNTHVLIEGDNNGVHVKLGFLEKGTHAVRCIAGTGPVVISGVDVEIMSEEAIIVDGTGVSGRPAGPVTILGCFLETSSSTKAVVKAVNAIVRVEGCRIRNLSGAAASGLAAFETSGIDAVIFDNGNQIQSTIGKRNVPGVVTNTQSGRTARRRVIRSSDVTLTSMDENAVYADPYNYDIPMAEDKIETVITSGGSQTVVARRTMTAEFHTGAASTGVAGIVLDATGNASNLTVRPPANNTNALGSASVQWKTAYLVSAPVVSSDRRKKLVHSESIPAALLDAWPKHVQYGVYSWKEDDGKGMRTGLFAQDIIAAFEIAGIDWREWAIIEVDDDGFYHVVKDEAQAIENAMVRRKLGI